MPINAAPATGPALRPLAVGITPLETRRDVVLQVATRAEELGYTALFVAEGWGHDVSVLLAELAHRTSRIRIGSGVINIWGRSAASLAMLATSLAEVSGGRFVLGLGAVTRQVRRLLDGERIMPYLGLGDAVDAVLEANQSQGSAEVPAAAQVLIDELTIWGDAANARAGLDRWYAFGAQMPVVVLPPNRGIDELEHVLDVLRPALRGSIADGRELVW